ncbi:MAG: hypothetical protein ACKV2T_35845 [Kofleriaceae bacterium]
MNRHLPKLVLAIATLASIATSPPYGPFYSFGQTPLPTAIVDTAYPTIVYTLDNELRAGDPFRAAELEIQFEVRDLSEIQSFETSLDVKVTNPRTELSSQMTILVRDGWGYGTLTTPAWLDCTALPCSESWRLEVSTRDRTNRFELNGTVLVRYEGEDPGYVEVAILPRRVDGTPMPWERRATAELSAALVDATSPTVTYQSDAQLTGMLEGLDGQFGARVDVRDLGAPSPTQKTVKVVLSAEGRLPLDFVVPIVNGTGTTFIQDTAWDFCSSFPCIQRWQIRLSDSSDPAAQLEITGSVEATARWSTDPGSDIGVQLGAVIVP